MKPLRNLSLLLLAIIAFSCSGNKAAESGEAYVKLVHDEENQRVDVTIGGQPFTSYLYTDTLPALTKPVLFPVLSAGGSRITRGFPLDPQPKERTDHPHHIGVWLNFGDLNGIDFWGNSPAIPAEHAHTLGVTHHEEMGKIESGNESGSLEVSMKWYNAQNQAMLKEETRFEFAGGDAWRRIDRVTTLTAIDEPMTFNDTKEGMMAIRVQRALEHPSDRPVTLSDAHGLQTEVAKLDNTGVTGHYLNSEGDEGLDAWGKRAGWVALDGTIGNEKVALIIFDHPDNVGHPTYWHARGYGLFAANPFGQATFSDGAEDPLNFSLNPGESVTFKYRILIHSGEIQAEEINEEYREYSSR
ncbi:MAG: PmoA family protein [Bacteroidota bacterium]